MCVMTRALICDPELPAKAARGPAGRHPRLHRLQPGLHRALPRGLSRSRASSSPRAAGSASSRARARRARAARRGRGHGSARDRRRPGRAQGGGRGGGARTPGHARARRSAGSAGRCRSRSSCPGARRSAARSPTSRARPGAPGVRIVTGVARRRWPTCGRRAPMWSWSPRAPSPIGRRSSSHGEPVVLDAWEVLAGRRVPAGPVVVADWRCDWVGLGLARCWRQRGHKVTLGVVGLHGRPAAPAVRPRHHDRRREAGTRGHPTAGAAVRGGRERGVPAGRADRGAGDHRGHERAGAGPGDRAGDELLVELESAAAADGSFEVTGRRRRARPADHRGGRARGIAGGRRDLRGGRCRQGRAASGSAGPPAATLGTARRS